jgi:hypothetical protein
MTERVTRILTKVLRMAACLLLGSAWAASALAQEKPYMALVGELVGAVENPRLVQEMCVSRFPKRRAEFTEAYSAWRTRHGEVLKAIDEQVARANLRLERQGAPPGASVVATVGGILKRRFDALDTGKARQLCDAYPEILKAKDEEMKSAIPGLLEAVTNASEKGAIR